MDRDKAAPIRGHSLGRPTSTFLLLVVQPPVIFDLFADKNPPLASEKRSHTNDDTLDGSEVRASKKKHREIEAARYASVLLEQIQMDKVRQQSIRASIFRVDIPQAASETYDVH